MNQQLYAEAGVKRKDNIMTLALRLLIIIAMLAGFFFIIVLKSLFTIIGAALVFIGFYFFPKLSIEYEYVFVDGQIDFDRIMGGNSRKTILRVDFDQVEVMAPASSHALDSYTYVKCETKDFTSGNKDNKSYVIIANIDNKKWRISFEPSEKMIHMMQQKSPRKVVLS